MSRAKAGMTGLRLRCTEREVSGIGFLETRFFNFYGTKDDQTRSAAGHFVQPLFYSIRKYKTRHQPPLPVGEGAGGGFCGRSASLPFHVPATFLQLTAA